MPDYLFQRALVLIEGTDDPASDATGVLRAAEGGDPVPIYDLNDSPLAVITVGEKGVHQAFKADIAHGVLDFGSVLLPTISLEAQVAALTAQQIAEDVNRRVAALETGVVAGSGRVLTMSRVPNAADLDEGDIVLVHPNFSG